MRCYAIRKGDGTVKDRYISQGRVGRIYPMAPTTKDLAEAAGVSLATVDRVLNGRGGVRKTKVEAVNAAIERIGFERNVVAATLARQRSLRLGFVLPKSGGEFLEQILRSIAEYEQVGRSEMIQTQVVRIEDRDAHKAARAIGRINEKDFDAVAIMATETPPVRDALHRLQERGVMTISFLSKQSNSAPEDFIGIDNRAAGATAGRLMGRFIGARDGAILAVAENLQSRDTLERRLGFDAVIGDSYANLRTLPTLETHGDPMRTHRVLENALNAHPDICGLYLLSGEAAVPISVARTLGALEGRIAIAHERTHVTEAALRSGELAAVIHQDPGHLVRSAVRIMRAKCEKRKTLASQERIRIEILVSENL